jgi:hypothetical protein
MRKILMERVPWYLWHRSPICVPFLNLAHWFVEGNEIKGGEDRGSEIDESLIRMANSLILVGRCPLSVNGSLMFLHWTSYRTER